MAKILNRLTNATIYEDGAPTMRETTIAAIKAGADLRGAYLRGAYLRGADLGDADLGDADLGGADLRDADLRDAYLGGAYLRGADLRDADLRDADLGGAYLRGAYLRGALGYDASAHVEPTTPYVRRTAPRNPAERIAYYRERHPDVPVVPDLDRKILEAIEAGGTLEMSAWHRHGCQTTHCRGGWAIHFAGEAGRLLEERYDSQRAATLIYRVSTGRVPNFFADNQQALEDIRACAAKQPAVLP